MGFKAKLQYTLLSILLAGDALWYITKHSTMAQRAMDCMEAIPVACSLAPSSLYLTIAAALFSYFSLIVRFTSLTTHELIWKTKTIVALNILVILLDTINGTIILVASNKKHECYCLSVIADLLAVSIVHHLVSTVLFVAWCGYKELPHFVNYVAIVHEAKGMVEGRALIAQTLSASAAGGHGPGPATPPVTPAAATPATAATPNQAGAAATPVTAATPVSKGSVTGSKASATVGSFKTKGSKASAAAAASGTPAASKSNTPALSKQTSKETAKESGPAPTAIATTAPAQSKQ